MSSSVVIAIDGPAASGKSSVSRALAARLHFSYMNTGAMYRAATWFILQRHIDLSDARAVVSCLKQAKIETGFLNGGSYIYIDGVDPSSHLNEPQVNEAVSKIAQISEVRTLLIAKQRELAARTSVIAEGRDMGSGVFPGTPYKFYIDASPEVRRQRRAAQGIIDDPNSRDKDDTTRTASPLKVASDAVIIDTSALTIDGVVEKVLQYLSEKGLQTSSI